jgi:hypothetical protein
MRDRLEERRSSEWCEVGAAKRSPTSGVRITRAGSPVQDRDGEAGENGDERPIDDALGHVDGCDLGRAGAAHGGRVCSGRAGCRPEEVLAGRADGSEAPARLTVDGPGQEGQRDRGDEPPASR